MSTADLAAFVGSVGAMSTASDDADRIDRVRLFEELKAIAAAAMALETRDFEASQRAKQAVDDVPAAQQGRGIAGQIDLARRTSPWSAQRWIG